MSIWPFGISVFRQFERAGKNISEVEFTNGSETKRRTNIWAGSALIAEQRRFGGQDTIIYLHADPVTGSKLEVSQTGQQSIYLGSDEVFEPLCQKIRTTPPFQEPPPPNPPPILNDSRSPEWQCTLFNMMGRSNDKMLPRHCSMVNEQDVWNTYYITPKNPGNPSALTNHSSGGSGSGSSDEPSRGFSVVKKRCSDPSEDDCTFRGPNAWEEMFEHNDAANGIDDAGMPLDEQGQLPKCLRDYLRKHFPDVQMGNFKVFSPVDDARFVSSSVPATLKTGAVTLGLYSIQYDSTKVDLTGGLDGSSIGTIVEEIAHAVQFIALWEKVEANSRPNGSYARAQQSWALAYLGESGRIEMKNLAKELVKGVTGIYLPKEDSYKANKYEIEAQAKRAIVQSEVDKLSKGPCY